MPSTRSRSSQTDYRDPPVGIAELQIHDTGRNAMFVFGPAGGDREFMRVEPALLVDLGRWQ
jgi:hypothetical protein